jgi:hypothetical protein
MQIARVLVVSTVLFTGLAGASLAQTRPGPIVLSTGKCLDVDESRYGQNGATVQTWDCTGRRNQSWSITQAGEITNGGKCLDIPANALGQNGTRVQMWDCNRQRQQIWNVYHDQITSRGAVGDGKCLDVHRPDANRNGAIVQVWACTDATNQKWMLPTQAVGEWCGQVQGRATMKLPCETGSECAVGRGTSARMYCTP